jgi:hypothetical protein
MAMEVLVGRPVGTRPLHWLPAVLTECRRTWVHSNPITTTLQPKSPRCRYVHELSFPLRFAVLPQPQRHALAAQQRRRRAGVECWSSSRAVCAVPRWSPVSQPQLTRARDCVPLLVIAGIVGIDRSIDRIVLSCNVNVNRPKPTTPGLDLHQDPHRPEAGPEL